MAVVRPGLGRWALLAIGLCAGCAADQPARTYRRWLELVAAGKARDAYQLMAPRYRETCDLPCFTRVAASSRDAARQALRRARPGHPEPVVELRVDLPLGPVEGERLVLRSVKRPGQAPSGWRISGDPLDFYLQNTPARALRSFVRAVEARRYDVLVRFVPQRLRQQVNAERLRERWEGEQRPDLLRQLDAVKRHLGEPPIVEGSDARLPVEERKEARLVLEEGRWHVVQLQ